MASELFETQGLMEKKYQVSKPDVDKWIRGQQRKLRDQFKRNLTLVTLSGISMPAGYSEDLRWRVVWHKFLLMKTDEEIVNCFSCKER
ncbi:hypothetical protein P5673_025022 [Acropora cervicornis]|uniref:Uncharacterized protein n=1 Tax=Acropora cervicornis TaxID=6130 RepID=A0AAD9Q2H0_ACRCE|nr:hypothetical protein P5673_025022 [Acropora cervicornis]